MTCVCVGVCAHVYKHVYVDTNFFKSLTCMNMPLRDTTMMEASTQRGSSSKNGPIHKSTDSTSNALTTDVSAVLLPAFNVISPLCTKCDGGGGRVMLQFEF